MSTQEIKHFLKNYSLRVCLECQQNFIKFFESATLFGIENSDICRHLKRV